MKRNLYQKKDRSTGNKRKSVEDIHNIHNIHNNDKKSSKTEVENTNENIELEKITKLSSEVMQKMAKHSIFPTPNNYQSFFYQELENNEKDISKEFNDILKKELSNNNKNEMKLLDIENKIYSTASSTKILMEIIKEFYITINKAKENVVKKSLTNEEIESYLILLEKNFNQIIKIFNKNINKLKENYTNNVNNFNSINSSYTFDKNYNIYNKLTLLDKVGEEILYIKEFNIKSYLMSFKIENLEKFKSNEIILMNKSLSTNLKKSLRTSDNLFYFGKGVFIIILKNCNKEQLEIAKERFLKTIDNIVLFLNEQEIEIKTENKTFEIDELQTIDFNISRVLLD